MDEVAPWSIGAKPNGVESAAQLGLVLWVSGQASQLMDSMGKLALVTVLAGSILLKRTAQLCLVPAGVDLTTRLLEKPLPIFRE